MHSIDTRQQQHAAASRIAATPARWRVGTGSVSTEELQAWQLGPARTDHWLELDGDARGPEGWT